MTGQRSIQLNYVPGFNEKSEGKGAVASQPPLISILIEAVIGAPETFKDLRTGRQFFYVKGLAVSVQMRLRRDCYFFFLGTFAPFFRASERPMAMACLRLLTVPPLPPRPDLSVPRFLRRIALATVFEAPLL